MNFLSLDKVFDLQTSKRSSSYLRIFYKKGICTSGIGKYAKIRHDNPERDKMHTLDRQAEQLKLSKVSFKKSIDLNWLYPKKQNKRKKRLLCLEVQKKDFIKEYQLKFFR